MPVIVVTSRDGVQTYVLEEGKPLFLGRASECDVVLHSTAVSRRHAVLLYKNGICGVKDLGSFNGTILNDKTIQEPHQLNDNDVLRISSYVVRLHTKDPDMNAIEEIEQPTRSKTTIRPREVHFEAGTFENSALPIPRAMVKQRELDREMKDFVPNSSDMSRDTQTFTPGKDTAQFMKTLADSALKNTEESEETSGYFTPFPIPDSAGDGETRSVSSPENGDEPDPELADFEESPLAPLENISKFEQKSPTPFLALAESFDAAAEFVSALQSDAEAIIPFGDDYDHLSRLSSEAEAIIPLIDDTPLVTTLRRDLLDDAADGGSEEQAFEDVSVSSPPPTDTAEYALAPEPGESDPVPDTGEYLIASVPPSVTPPEGVAPVMPDFAEQAASGNEGSGTGGSGAEQDDADEFGGKPPSTDSHRTVANVGGVGAHQTSIKGKSSLSGVASITISSNLMAAINTRLSLYSLLYDLVEERKRFRETHPDLPEDVEAELDRQDQELNNLPTAEEADQQLAVLEERNQQLEIALFQAEEADVAGPPPPTKEMLAAEDFAVTQWILISDSNRQALPGIYREAYALATEEPLTKELSAAHIAHGRLMGGAIYLLALESLATMANSERFRISRKMRKLEEGDEEEEGFFGKLGKFAGNIMNRTHIREELARLADEDRVNEIRAELANRESRFMEKTLSREFKQVYKKAALRYIPEFETMPVAIRAFLRHGVIGFSPWWLTKEAREHIVRDCTDNIIPEFSHGPGDINVLYADEYLYAVSQMECSPSPDDDLMSSSLNSTEWKTDRAYRRIVNARSYNVLMEEMITQLDLTGKYLQEEALNLEKRINAIKDRGFSGGEHMFELQTEHQQFCTREEGIRRNIRRVQEELIPSILEAIEDAERRFRTGDLRIPDQETLIRREVGAMFRIGRRLEEDAERFMPMVVREHYRFRSDVVNDRAAVRSILVKMEEMDPNIFMRTIIPSKHKKNRVDLRMSPTVMIFPAAGRASVCSMGREGMESGHLVMPTCFVKHGIRSRQVTNMLADFRWETSRVEAGRDVIKSNTLAGAFTKIRWMSRQQPKNRREKQMLFTDVPEKDNWRRVYEVYLPDALNGGRLLFQRNPELYEAVVGKYIDPPDGVKILRRGVV